MVCHLDRLARDAAALLDWLERAGRQEVELHVGRGRIETESASGQIAGVVEGIVAAYYRKVIAEKRVALSTTDRLWTGALPSGTAASLA